MATVAKRTRSHAPAELPGRRKERDGGEAPRNAKRQRTIGPKSEANFRPQPGDVIIRQIPHAAESNIVSVMGLLKIYADDYYFMYEDGQTHLLKFSFRSGDRILRFGQFTSRFYTWKDNEWESLYLLYAPPDVPPVEATEWYEVARHRNRVSHDFHPREIPYYSTDLDIRAPPFTVLADDFIIHKDWAEAPDRPWGLSYELRRAHRNYDPLDGDDDEQVEFGPDDIVIRVRMTKPPDINDVDYKLREDMLEVFDQIQELDAFVPIYVHGWLCLGGEDAVWTRFRWRYLGMDHHIFRNYQMRAQVNKGLKRYGSCPALPGDVVFNTDERILLDGVHGTHSGGHAFIFRDDGDWAPLDLPGSMIIRFGRFANTEAVIDPAVRPIWNGLENSFAVFHETAPELIVHDQLTRTGWVEAKLQRRSGLADMSLADRPRSLQYFSQMRLIDQVLNRPIRGTIVPHVRDVVVNTNPHWANELLLSRHFKLARTDGDAISAILENDYERLFKFRLMQPQERTFNCFFWNPRYVFRHGDCLIRYFLQKSESLEGRWFASVEFYQYHLIPAMWKPDAEPVWVYRGHDTACLPIGEIPDNGD